MKKANFYFLLSLVFLSIIFNSVVNQEYFIIALCITGLVLLVVDIYVVNDIKLVIT